MIKDLLKLHFVIFIWGFTAILAAAIVMPALELVFWRTALSAVALLCLLRGKKLKVLVDYKGIAAMLGTGVLVALHWALFFAAIKLSGASIGLIGLSTCALWIALFEPLMTKRKVSYLEILFGALVTVSLSVIANAEVESWLGLLLSVLAAVVAAMFSIINAKLSRQYHHFLITYYEMLGAAVCGLVFVFIYKYAFYPAYSIMLVPQGMDWIYILILSLVCTVYAYSACVELLQRLSPFITSLSVNLEPLYGIALAALLLKEYQQLTLEFYLGSALIILTVVSYPILRKQLLRKQLPIKWKAPFKYKAPIQESPSNELSDS